MSIETGFTAIEAEASALLEIAQKLCGLLAPSVEITAKESEEFGVSPVAAHLSDIDVKLVAARRTLERLAEHTAESSAEADERIRTLSGSISNIGNAAARLEERITLVLVRRPDHPTIDFPDAGMPLVKRINTLVTTANTIAEFIGATADLVEA